MTLKIYKSQQKQHTRISKKGKQFIAGKQRSNTDKLKKMYHVTFKKNIEKILNEGIKPQKIATFHGAFGQDIREHKNKIYLFSSFDDAARWAFKTEYDTKELISIIEIEDDLKKYKKDKHWESGMAKGNWLIGNAINKDKITNIIDFDSKKLGPLLVQTNDPNKILMPDGNIKIV